MRSFELDMSKGSIFKNTLLFAIPLMLTSLLQLLYNAADLIVVSRFSGSDAMASVGSTAAITNLILNVSIGLSVGGSVVAARKFGEKDNAGMHRVVHTAMLLGIVLGIITCAVGLIFTRPLLVLMGTPEGKVMDGAVLYMKIIFLGSPAAVLYNFGAAILRALGDTKRPLYILAATGLINVILNLILVVGFHMSVDGVAIGTIMANYLSAIAVVIIFMKENSSYKLELNKLKFYKEELLNIIKIGFPAGIQGSFFSLSNSVIQSSVNSFGAVAVAGSAAAVNVEGFLYVSMNAFHQSALTAVSQNYGAKDKKRINKSIYVSTLVSIVVGLVLGILSFIFRRQILGIYITDSPEALEIGSLRLMILAALYFTVGIMEVLTGALRGLGCSTVTAVNSLFGACIFRVGWAVFLLPLHRDIGFLFLCMPLSWIVVCILHFVTLLFVKPRAMKRIEN